MSYRLEHAIRKWLVSISRALRGSGPSGRPTKQSWSIPGSLPYLVLQIAPCDRVLVPERQVGERLDERPEQALETLATFGKLGRLGSWSGRSRVMSIVRDIDRHRPPGTLRLRSTGTKCPASVIFSSTRTRLRGCSRRTVRLPQVPALRATGPS
jgi:hypothetical protein